jgi:hypothetical protein
MSNAKTYKQKFELIEQESISRGKIITKLLLKFNACKDTLPVNYIDVVTPLFDEYYNNNTMQPRYKKKGR